MARGPGAKYHRAHRDCHGAGGPERGAEGARDIVGPHGSGRRLSEHVPVLNPQLSHLLCVAFPVELLPSPSVGGMAGEIVEGATGVRAGRRIGGKFEWNTYGSERRKKEDARRGGGG
eukprot:843511-Pyramimonas_sp.AAC.1